jgi:hypothetical protein
MDLIAIVVQVLKDLLGPLNPLLLFRSEYRARFCAVWREEGLVFRVGYVLGVLGLAALVSVAGLWLWTKLWPAQ